MRRITAIVATCAATVGGLLATSVEADAASPSARAQTVIAGTSGVPWDFNSDGYADLAVGAPLENVADLVDAGSVTVIPGGPDGPTGSGAVVWTQNSSGVPGTAERGDQFGIALASADYDGDGYADLAVGSNAEDVGTASNVGSVTVIKGSPAGLTGAGSYSPTATMTPKAEKYAGEDLASLDFNGDGIVDLAVGLPGTNKAAVYEGSPAGATTLVIALSENTSGVPGTTHAGEGFGSALAAGDFDGDGFDDLAVGAPFDYDDRDYSVGAVVVVPGAELGMDTARSQRISPDSPGIAGSGHVFGANDSSDYFGGLLAAGDLSGDGLDDLAIGAPGAPVTTSGVKHEDAGEVHVILGSASGLTDVGNTLISKDATGVPGSAIAHDGFGRSLDIGFDRAGTSATLAVGSERVQAVTLLPAGNGAGATSISQETPGVPGGTEDEDDFSAFVRFTFTHGGGLADLAISSDGENGHAGTVLVIPSTSTGPAPLNGTLALTEDTLGIPGIAEPKDRWGWLGDSH